MRLLSLPIFWGIIVVLFGVSIIVKHLFHINLPFFRLLIGIVIILAGISIIMGDYKKQSSGTFFNGKKFDRIYENYSVVFGQGVIDLTKTEGKTVPSQIEISTIFGQSVIYIDKEKEFYIKGNSAFGYIEMPDEEGVAFGDIKRTYGASNEKIVINVNNVFAKTSVVYK